MQSTWNTGSATMYLAGLQNLSSFVFITLCSIHVVEQLLLQHHTHILKKPLQTFENSNISAVHVCVCVCLNACVCDHACKMESSDFSCVSQSHGAHSTWIHPLLPYLSFHTLIHYSDGGQLTHIDNTDFIFFFFFQKVHCFAMEIICAWLGETQPH